MGLITVAQIIKEGKIYASLEIDKRCLKPLVNNWETVHPLIDQIIFEEDKQAGTMKAQILFKKPHIIIWE